MLGYGPLLKGAPNYRTILNLRPLLYRLLSGWFWASCSAGARASLLVILASAVLLPQAVFRW